MVVACTPRDRWQSCDGKNTVGCCKCDGWRLVFRRWDCNSPSMPCTMAGACSAPLQPHDSTMSSIVTVLVAEQESVHKMHMRSLQWGIHWRPVIPGWWLAAVGEVVGRASLTSSQRSMCTHCRWTPGTCGGWQLAVDGGWRLTTVVKGGWRASRWLRVVGAHHRQPRQLGCTRVSATLLA